MFGSRRLIGTPSQGASKRDGSHDLEFTPVGEEMSNRSIRQENNMSPLQHRRANVVPKIRSPLLDHDTSFDNTSHSFDTIVSDHEQQQWKPDLNFLQELGQKVGFGKTDDDHQVLLSNGSNPLKQQHDTISRLKEENINLRVRLATLTRYFGEEPADTRDLINHNVELKQSLLEMNSKLESLNVYIRELEANEKENQTTVQNSHVQEQLTRENNHLQNLLKRTRSDLETKIEELESENGFLAQNQERLQSEIADLKQVSHHDRTAMEQDHLDFEELNDRVMTLQAQLKSKDNLVEQLQEDHDELEAQLRSKTNFIEQLQEDQDELQAALRSKDDVVGQLESQVDNLSAKNDKLEQELDNLTSKLADQQQDQNHASSGDQELEDMARLVKSLRNELKISDRELHSVQDNEARLVHELESLERQLQKSQQNASRDQDKIRDLQSKLKSLQLRREHGEVESHGQLESVIKERDELYEQLLDREEKVDQLDRELNSANLEKKSLLKKRSNKDDDLVRLRDLNDQLQGQIESMQRESRSKDLDIEQLSLELEDAQRLIQDQQQHRRVYDENPYLEQEIRRLTDKNNELQHLVNSMSFTDDSKVEKLAKKNESLKSELEAKDNEIEKLSMKIREVTRANKMSLIDDDEEKVTMMQELSKLKTKLKLANVEKENLKEEYSLKLSILKKQVEKGSSSELAEQMEKKLHESIKLKDELLLKLTERQQEYDEVASRNDKLSKDNKELERIMFALEENETKLMRENKKYARDLAKLKQMCNKLMARAKRNSGSDDSVQLALDNANKEIDILTEKYLKLRRDLTTKIESLEESKQKLKQKVVSMQQLPTPVASPRADRSSTHGTELQLYKLKSFQQATKIRDLQNYNQILQKSIARTDQVMKANIITIDENLDSGSNWRRDDNSKRITFKALAKFVLAGVRLQNRLKEAQLNKVYAKGLSKEIGRMKLEAL